MTPICITGSAHLPAQALQALMAQGLPQAAALHQNGNMDLQTWHRRVLAQPNQPPGRVWQQLAAELVIANIAHPCWAWADPQSMALLEFWADFDASIRFLLVTQTPAQALLHEASSHSDQDSEWSISIGLQQWLLVHQRLMHFALRHPERTQIVWAQTIDQHPRAVAEHLVRHWSLDWTPANVAQTTTGTSGDLTADTRYDSLADHLADQIARSHPSVQQLYADLQSCISPVEGGASGNNTKAPNDPLSLLRQFETLRQEAGQARQLSALQAQLKSAQGQVQTLRQEHQQASAALQKTQQQQQQQLEQKVATLQSAHDQLQANASGLENELTQARQQAKQQSQQIQQQTDKLKATEQQLQAAGQQAHQLGERLKAAEKEAHAAREKAGEQARQSDKTLADLRQQISALGAELQSAREQAAPLTGLQQSLQDKSRQLAETEKARKEAQEEADTLLLQLHETQEELESYCIQNDELEQQMQAFKTLQKRWIHLFETHTDLFAVQTLSVTPQYGSDRAFAVECQQLSIAGRHFEALSFTVSIEDDGCASLTFVRPESEFNTLHRWPADCQTGQPLCLHPGSGPGTAPQRMASLLQLSTSDWRLVEQLPLLLIGALEQNVTRLETGQALLLQGALRRFVQELRPLSAFCRFDTALVTRLPDEQQLQLQIERPSFEGHNAPHIGLRLLREQASSPDGLGLEIEANAYLPSPQTLRLQLGPTGWQSETEWPTDTAWPARLAALLAALPIALVDSVHHGANKSLLKPWADAVRQLRQWPQKPQALTAPGAVAFVLEEPPPPIAPVEPAALIANKPGNPGVPQKRTGKGSSRRERQSLEAQATPPHQVAPLVSTPKTPAQADHRKAALAKAQTSPQRKVEPTASKSRRKVKA